MTPPVRAPSFMLSRLAACRLRASTWLRLSVASRNYAKQMPPRKKIEDADIEESFLKGSGPGGQKINKTNSAVQLKHLESGIVVKCQETRSRSQNRKIARRILEAKLDQRENGDESRMAIKAAAKAKKKASADKKKKRKYRRLADVNEKQDGDDAEAEISVDMEAGPDEMSRQN